MIDDRVVAITGANTGIGKSTAIALAQQGYRMILLARKFEHDPIRYSAMSEDQAAEIWQRSEEMTNLLKWREEIFGPAEK